MPEYPPVVYGNGDKYRPAVRGQPQKPHGLGPKAKGGREKAVLPAPGQRYEHREHQTPYKTCLVGGDQYI